jgi:Ig-like domain CHU_C associated/Secretion system C-terminal sorting domain
MKSFFMKPIAIQPAFFTLWGRIALFFITFCAFSTSARASHLLGGDLTYEHISGNTYRFTFKFYRDCAGITPSTTMTAYIDGCGNTQQTVPLTQYAVTEVQTTCPTGTTNCTGGTSPGLQEYTYTGFYTFPSVCNAWKVSMTEASRNLGINTIPMPSTPDFYIEMTIDNSTDNSSPVFSHTPIYTVCAGQAFTYNPGMVDSEGDSLAYALVNPIDGRLFNPLIINYIFPFSAASPLTTASGTSVVFNAKTGQISFTPSTVGQITISTLLVKEYRNGVLIGSTMRDIQIVVLNCGANQNPTTSAPTNITGATFAPATNSGEFVIGVGQTMSFSLTANDGNAVQVLTLLSNLNLSCPGAIANITTGTGNTKTFNFTWTPTRNNIGTRILTIEARDNNCPAFGYIVKGFAIKVEGVRAHANIATMCVGSATSVSLSAQASTTGGTYQWSAVPSIGSIPSGQNIAVSIKKATVFTVTYTLNGIATSDTMMVRGYGGVSATPAVVSNYLITDPPIQLNTTYPNPTPMTPLSCGAGNVANCTGAQVNRIIGTSGTNTLAGGGVGTPYQGFWHDGRIQLLYTAAELMAAGMQAGLITRLQFNISQKNSTAPYLGFTIKMGCSALTQLTAANGFEAGLTTVYTNATGVTTTVGLNNYNFQTPYQWDGLSSIIVEVCFDNTTFSGYDHVTATPTSQNTVLYKRQDGASGCTLTAPAASTQRPDIVLRNCPIVIAAPTIAYTWTVAPAANGALSSTTIANPTATANANAEGSNVLYVVSASDGRCTSKDTVVVGVINNSVTCNTSLVVNASNTELTCNTTNATLTATAINGTQPFSYTWSNGITSANNTVTNLGIYTITVTDALGCSATASIAVTQNMVPPVVSVAGNTMLCSGGQGVLIATGGNLFTWNTNETTAAISVFSGGIYTVTTTDGANGCTATAAIAVTQNANPVPSIQGNNTICQGSTATMCATVGYTSYLWSNGASGQCTQFTNSGIHTVTVTDANGCSAAVSIALTVRVTPVVNLLGTTTFCAGGRTTICASNGFNTYTWSNGDTQRCLIINVAGVYTVTISDANNCTATNSVTIVKDSIAPPTVTPSNITINCNSSTTLTASGSSIYFRWFDTPVGGNALTGFATFTTPILTANTTYFVDQISSMGCPSERTAVNVTIAGPNCATTISGYVLHDNNINCVRDAGDIGIASYANLKLTNTQTNIIRYFSTDINGFYQTTTDTGQYVLVLSNPLESCNDSLVCPSQNRINIHAASLFGNYPNNNFYYQYNGLPQTDITCSLFSTSSRVGRTSNFFFSYNNLTNTIAPNVSVSLTKAAEWTNLTVRNGYLPYNTQNGNIYTWNIGDIPPNSGGIVLFRMDLPTTVPVGISLSSALNVISSSVITDCNPANNTFVYNQITRNSYDPNDKTLLNAQNDMGGVLNDGADLNYQIRFQNTGTDTAYTVVVRDSIDASRLDLQSLKITAASHNVALRWENPNIAVFEFLNINLVDSVHNEADSHGFIQYSIAPLANTPMFGTTDNTANIFFDFNDPVRTNTVHTTFVPFLATDMPAAFAPSIVLQPNPTADVLTIKTDIASAYTLTLQDALGRILQTQSIAQASTELNVQHLPQGTYFIQIKTTEGQITKRFVKM